MELKKMFYEPEPCQLEIIPFCHILREMKGKESSNL